MKKYFKETFTLTKATLMSAMLVLMLVASLATLGLEAEFNRNNTIVVEAGYDYESEITELETKVKDLQETVDILEAKNASINTAWEQAEESKEFFIELTVILEKDNENLEKLLEEKEYKVQIAYCALWRAGEISINHIDAWFGYIRTTVNNKYVSRQADGWTIVYSPTEYYEIRDMIDLYYESYISIIAENGELSPLQFCKMMEIPEILTEMMTEEIPEFKYSSYDFWNVIEPFMGR